MHKFISRSILFCINFQNADMLKKDELLQLKSDEILKKQEEIDTLKKDQPEIDVLKQQVYSENIFKLIMERFLVN